VAAVSGVAGLAVSGAAEGAGGAVSGAAAHAGERAAFARLHDLADELRRSRPWSLSRHCCSELKIGLIAAAQKLCPQCVNWGTSSGRRISLEL
jgi:hypothetical protein